jgi:CheY-like chemotaxis protein
MSVSILAVDDEVDVADMFRQHFRREVRQGQYVLHFARSAEEALDKLARGGASPAMQLKATAGKFYHLPPSCSRYGRYG